MIRPARVADLPAMVDLALGFHDKSVYSIYKTDPKRMRMSLLEVISNRTGFAVVAEHGGKITGMLAGAKQELWFTRQLYASDIIFVSRQPGDGARMVRKFESWAFSDARVKEVTLAISSGIHPEGTSKLYEALGFEYLGPMYMKHRESPHE